MVSSNEGVLSPTSNTQSIWIHNKCLSDRIIEPKTHLFKSYLLNVVPINIELKEPVPEPQNFEMIGAANTFSSLNNKIWDKINSEPDPQTTLLTDLEQKLDHFDEYFLLNTDNDFLSQHNISDDLSPKERYLFYKLLVQNRAIFAYKGDPLGRVNVLVTSNQYW